ncbi:MAG: hypothetical protein L0332_04225 [Chloroflexi bacterium]|nr:hypothetical protein [Chloroflexota bacterium]MCI0577770.1 hypothetical protein [Chloroflexota bacterium]MCI0643424.1 hypothetical protein [Chloroflexota bacterium]MCI0725917.1 hypothetical protein [Chloroflexota bacterium]
MRVEEILEKALKNLELRLPKTSLGGWNFGNEIPAWRRCFEVIQATPGASRKFDTIANVRDTEQLKDTLTEIKYAVIFAQLGFQVEIEPLSNQQEASSNPDLRITQDGYSSIVEIKRFRAPGPFSPGQRLQPLPDEVPETYVFPPYGDPIKDIQKIFTEIENKFRQAGTEGIIAIWNDNDELSPPEVGTAVNRLKLHSSHSLKSSFVLLRGDPSERFSCFELRDRLAPYQEQWMSELKQVTPDDILGRISDEAKFRRRG